ncbi:hypothetical protein HQ520_04775 [bacterium]|nr:hypothetical protein [bacterium]
MSKVNGSPPRIGCLVFGRERPGFDPEWGHQMVDRINRFWPDSGVQCESIAPFVTNSASLDQSLSEARSKQVDVLVLCQPTMADARLVPQLHQVWNGPLVIWATPENPRGEMISSCSLVGTHNWASLLCRLEHPFELVFGAPEAEKPRVALRQAIAAAAAAQRLRTSRLMVVGGTAPGYFAMATDGFVTQKCLGTEVQFDSLEVFFQRIRDLSEAEVEADVETFKAMGFPLRGVDEGEYIMASRAYLAMRRYFSEDGCDAVALRCWPELSNVTGQWPYIGMARLAEEGRPVAMEGDGDGALCGLIAEAMGAGPCYLSDWLEHDEQTIHIWHTGTMPWTFSHPIGDPRGPHLARHFNNQKPLVLESTMREGIPLTLYRLWRFGDRFRISAAEAQSQEPDRHLLGNNAVARLRNRRADEWFLDLCHAGTPHHIAVVKGHWLPVLKSFARMLNIEWVP